MTRSTAAWSATRAVLRHGVRLGALAEHLLRGPQDQGVLVDRAGPLTRRGLVRAVERAVPAGAPSLARISGRHDRSAVVSLLAHALAGWDAMVLHPQHPSLGADPEPWPAAGRLWLGTSGTTGESRPFARPRYGPGIVRPVRQVWRRWRLSGPGSILVQPALHHGYGLGMTLACLLAGRTVLLPTGADHLEAMVDTHRPEITVSVPVQLTGLPRIPGWAPRTMITGSGPLSPEVQQRTVEHFGPVLHNLFGSTEAGFATMASPDDLALSPGCVGRPLAGVGVRLRNGRVEVRSPFATHRPGWVETRDRGHLDEHGLLVLDGRVDRVAVVNGVNVEPGILAQLLASHPAVASAEVDAVPDVVRGHRLTATVRLHAPATGAELADWLRGRGAPTVAVVVDAPPVPDPSVQDS